METRPQIEFTETETYQRFGSRLKFCRVFLIQIDQMKWYFLVAESGLSALSADSCPVKIGCP